MALIKGIPVTLISKTQTDTDPFGNPVYTETETVVENVLVAPVSSEDRVHQQNLTGRSAVYQLAIPKNDTHEWENAEVRFFGERWRVFGIPTQGMDHLIPLDWNKKVMVERYE